MVKRALFQEESFAAAADHDFAAQNKVKVIVFAASDEKHRVDKLIQLLVLKQIN